MAEKRGEAKGREQGHEEGRKEGQRLAMVATIEQLCASFGIEVDAARRAELDAASLDDLQSLVQRLIDQRSWPTQ
jgi:flagellar biosynthesis/type III secretory pathway protein FliH